MKYLIAPFRRNPNRAVTNDRSSASFFRRNSRLPISLSSRSPPTELQTRRKMKKISIFFLLCLYSTFCLLFFNKTLDGSPNLGFLFDFWTKLGQNPSFETKRDFTLSFGPVSIETDTKLPILRGFVRNLILLCYQRRWNPDAIVFNSWQQYGTPSYWMQQFFTESSGATLLPTVVRANASIPAVADAIIWKNSQDNSKYLKIKIVNFGSDSVNLEINVSGLQNTINSAGSKRTILTSNNEMDENSFQVPNKVVPMQSTLPNAGSAMNVVLSPHSFISFDLSLGPASLISEI